MATERGVPYTFGGGKKPPYDVHATFYVDFVDQQLSNKSWQILIDAFDHLLGSRVVGASICDFACGEGYLGRHLAELGAARVLGIDISPALIKVAEARRDSDRLEYRVDDARTLGTISDASFDVAVSQLALMDISDHRTTFRSVKRILKPQGMLIFSVLHPCFEGSPFRMPDEPLMMRGEDGIPIAYSIRRYSTEGFWESGGDGVRGRVGSYHRTISTYVNELIDAGFSIVRLIETVHPGPDLLSEVPQHLVLAAVATSSEGDE